VIRFEESKISEAIINQNYMKITQKTETFEAL
jgi:hypothetical protein